MASSTLTFVSVDAEQKNEPYGCTSTVVTDERWPVDTPRATVREHVCVDLQGVHARLSKRAEVKEHRQNEERNEK